MTSATVEFRKTKYIKGETVIADFTWFNAKWNFKGATYGTLSIYRPNRTIATHYSISSGSEGSRTLSATGSDLGTWEARVRLWNGTKFTVLAHYTIVVTSAAPPPAPPPTPPPAPPPDSGITLTVNTNPNYCRVTLYGDDGLIYYDLSSGGAGSVSFQNVPVGTWQIHVSKGGYDTEIWTRFITSSFTLNIPLNPTAPTPPEEPEPGPPPEEPEGVWGWIVNFVIGGLEGLLGWTAGSLLNVLGDTWDIITSFGGQISDFFGDVAGNISSFVIDGIADALSWISDNFLTFLNWLESVGGDIANYVGGAISDAVSFVTENFTNFVDWLNEIGGSVADYVGGAIGDFVDWSQDQLGSIWIGLQVWFIEAIWGFIESFFMGLNDGIEEAKGSPLHSNEPVRNPVLRGLKKVVRKHRKEHNRNIITGEKENGDI